MKLLLSELRLRFFLRLLVAGLFSLPLLWMAAASLHPPGSPLPHSLSLFPSGITASNFSRVTQLVPLGRYLANSMLVVSLAVPLTLLTGSWAGFGMALMPRASQRGWVVFSLAILMVPGIGLWFSRFLVYRELGWLNSVWALIAPAWMGTSPFYALMFYRAFRRIPREVYDSARLDGAGVLAIWARVGLPIARPTVVGVAILSFAFYWGDFISPLLYLRSESQYTLPIALQLLGQMDPSDWSLLMAAAVIATAVPIALFILIQPTLARLGEEAG